MIRLCDNADEFGSFLASMFKDSRLNVRLTAKNGSVHVHPNGDVPHTLLFRLTHFQKEDKILLHVVFEIFDPKDSDCSIIHAETFRASTGRIASFIMNMPYMEYFVVQ